MSKDTPRSHTPPGEGMRRLISDILASTVPEKRLKEATAIAIDQTAFPSFFAPATSESRKTLTEQSQKRSARPGRFPMTSSWEVPTGSSSAAPTATLVPGTAQPAQPPATKLPTSSASRSL